MSGTAASEGLTFAFELFGSIGALGMLLMMLSIISIIKKCFAVKAM